MRAEWTRRCCCLDDHTLATAALCCCTFSNAFLVISVFPYAGYMVIDLVPGTTTETAGVYAGFLASSFFAARVLTAYQWGRIADSSWGRTRTLQVALSLSAIFSILFGCSKSFAAALIWRAGLGLSNGIISTVKTAATEIASSSSDNDEKLQRRTMGLVVGMRSWGLLVAPAIAGFLAEPIKQYPGVFDESTLMLRAPWIFRTLFTYPFLLPNIFGASCCLTAVTAIHFFLPETLQTATTETDDDRNGTNQPHQSTASLQEAAPLLVKPESGSSLRDTSEGTKQQQFAWSRPLTRSHMMAHWMFSVASTYIDEAFPLFCMSVTGGLALPEAGIGKILSGAGLLFAVFQYATFASLTKRFGLYRSLTIGCLLGTIPVTIVPLSVLLRRNYQTSWFAVFLSITMGFTKLMHSLYYTSMAVAINKTVTSSQRARMNALVTTGNSIAKAFGPCFAGSLVTFSFSGTTFSAEYGSVLVWSMVPAMGLIVALQIQRLRHQVDSSA